jgi:hypothetical protein
MLSRVCARKTLSRVSNKTAATSTNKVVKASRRSYTAAVRAPSTFFVSHRIILLVGGGNGCVGAM